jgi:hypothetical protein
MGGSSGRVEFLGYTAMAERNFAEAERLFRDALREYDTVQPINQWNKVRPRGRIISGLGQAPRGQAKLSEAEPLLVAGFSELVAQRCTLWGDPRGCCARRSRLLSSFTVPQANRSRRRNGN